MVPTDFKDFIRQCGGPTPFAKHMYISREQAWAMSSRNTISPIYWEECIELAKELGIPGVTAEWFFALMSDRRGKWRRPRP